MFVIGLLCVSGLQLLFQLIQRALNSIELCTHHMGVDFSRFDILVTKQHLYHSYVYPVFQ